MVVYWCLGCFQALLLTNPYDYMTEEYKNIIEQYVVSSLRVFVPIFMQDNAFIIQ